MGNPLLSAISRLIPAGRGRRAPPRPAAAAAPAAGEAAWLPDEVCARICKDSYGERCSVPGFLDCRLESCARTDSQALLCRHEGGEVVVAYRGTQGRLDVAADLNVGKRRFTAPGVPACSAHAGFLWQLGGLGARVDRYLIHSRAGRVTFTGHSLGGALATLHSLRFAAATPGAEVRCVTFGSPRVGDSEFARAARSLVPNSRRYVVPGDPVPRVPTRLRWEHAAPPTLLPDSGGPQHTGWSGGGESLLRAAVPPNPINVGRHSVDVYIERLAAADAATSGGPPPR